MGIVIVKYFDRVNMGMINLFAITTDYIFYIHEAATK